MQLKYDGENMQQSNIDHSRQYSVNLEREYANLKEQLDYQKNMNAQLTADSNT
jgi:hypothetical protein